MQKNNYLNSTNEPFLLFVKLLFSYVMLFSLASVLQSGLIKALANLFAIAVFVVMFVNWAFLLRDSQFVKTTPVFFILGLFFYYFGLIGSFFFNYQNTDYVDFIKFFMAPMFLVFGVFFEYLRKDYLFDFRYVQVLFFLLIFVPILIWAVQLAMGKTEFGSGQMVAFFPNRNTASLYAVALLALYNVMSPKPLQNIWIYIIVAFMFGALGVLVSVLAALIISIASKRTMLLLTFFFAVLSGLVIYFPDFVLFKRFYSVFGTIELVLNGTIDLYNVSFGEVVRMLNSTDLSFLFRLKHWLELFVYYANGEYYELLFGYGVGSTIGMTLTHLIPHNDYLRILLENGVFSLFGFLLIIFTIVLKTFRRWEAVPLLAVIIYFSSENLINSYASMLIFYFSSGATVYRLMNQEGK